MSVAEAQCLNINTALNMVYSSFHREEFEEIRREAPARLLDIHQRSFPGDIRDLPDNEIEDEKSDDIYFPEGGQK